MLERRKRSKQAKKSKVQVFFSPFVCSLKFWFFPATFFNVKKEKKAAKAQPGTPLYKKNAESVCEQRILLHLPCISNSFSFFLENTLESLFSHSGLAAASALAADDAASRATLFPSSAADSCSPPRCIGIFVEEADIVEAAAGRSEEEASVV